MGASQGVVFGSTHSHPEFLQVAPWKSVAFGKKVKFKCPVGLYRLMTWPSPAVFRAVLVSWATFWAEFGSTCYLLQPGPHLPWCKIDPQAVFAVVVPGAKGVITGFLWTWASRRYLWINSFAHQAVTDIKAAWVPGGPYLFLMLQFKLVFAA